jgi:hypothetical protein
VSDREGGTHGDAGTSPGSGIADAADAAATGKVPMFVAQGDLGRTTVSCDDGRTWVGNRSWDTDGDPLLCGSTTAKTCWTPSGGTQCTYSIGGSCVQRECCNDTPDVAKGVTYGDGKFVATWGWGSPGAVKTSTNGIDWTTTLPKANFGGIAFGTGHFVVASRDPFVSPDGTTWTAGGTADFRNKDGSMMWSVRRFAYAEYNGGGRFIAAAAVPDRDMLISSDSGQSWWRPSVLPDLCATNVGEYGGIVSGNNVIVIVGQDANSCRSADGGHTWSLTPTGLTQVLSYGVWTGSQFLFWGDDRTMISSPDGTTWTKTPMVTPHRIGPVARSASTGTLVAVSYDSYANQRFYRSTDGLTWDALPSSAFAPSHAIFSITFGDGDPSAVCPQP